MEGGRVWVQWKEVQGGSPEGTLAWVRQKGCSGADDKVLLASTGREDYAGGGFHRGAAAAQPPRTQLTPQGFAPSRRDPFASTSPANTQRHTCNYSTSVEAPEISQMPRIAIVALAGLLLSPVSAQTIYPPTLANCTMEEKIAALAPAHVGVVWIEREGETLEDIRADFATSECRRSDEARYFAEPLVPCSQFVLPVLLRSSSSSFARLSLSTRMTRGRTSRP